MERLIQEDFTHNPWKMLVCCILLNQTSNVQVRKVLDDLFNLIPNPPSAVSADPVKIESVIRSTGFSKIKTDRIQRLSSMWLSGFSSVSQLPGVGKYASDSWEIFVNKNLDVCPTDKKLIAYLERFK